MAIDQSKYIQITSGVGAASNVGTRAVDGTLITDNDLVPTGELITFNSADEVGEYFGTDSEEYARAVFYFSWISKNITSPKALNFWFWNQNVASGSLIFGAPGSYALSSFSAVSNGDLTLTLGGTTHHLTGINCTGAASLSGVASVVETAINNYVAGGSAWVNAAVEYDATRGSFNLTSGATGSDTVAVTAGTINDLATRLGWLTGSILSNGTNAQTVAAMLAELNNTNNNFSSFAFIPELSQSDVVAAANWNNSLPSNNQYMYTIPVAAASAATLSAALMDIGGCTVTLSPDADEYPEMVPMTILAATDYTRQNSVQNYMFQQFDLTPSVDNNTDYETYKDLRVNFYGVTQTAGQEIAFYQEGVMMGLPVDPVDQNVYANEIWFKSACSAALMNLLLALPQVPANTTGKAQILATLQSIIDQALFNGTISVGKPLNNTQKLYITNVTGSATAWQQVQSLGYWVDCVIQSYVESGVTKWKAVYTIIYSKNDVIRKIEGTDILI